MPAGQIDEPCPAGCPAVLLVLKHSPDAATGNEPIMRVAAGVIAPAALRPSCGPNSRLGPPPTCACSRARWARMPGASFFVAPSGILILLFLLLLRLFLILLLLVLLLPRLAIPARPRRFSLANHRCRTLESRCGNENDSHRQRRGILGGLARCAPPARRAHTGRLPDDRAPRRADHVDPRPAAGKGRKRWLCRGFS